MYSRIIILVIAIAVKKRDYSVLYYLMTHAYLSVLNHESASGRVVEKNMELARSI